MSRTDTTSPERLREQRDASPLASVVAEVRQNAHDEPLSQIALARVRARLEQRRHPPMRRGVVPGLRFATVAVVLLLGASAGATATFLVLRPSRPAVDVAAAEPPAPARARRAALAQPRPQAAMPETPPPAQATVDEGPPSAASVRTAAPRPRVRPSAVTMATTSAASPPPEAAPPPLAPDPAAAEATLVAQAMRLLQEPAGFDEGLRHLRGYLAAEPRGVFAREARTALITALAQRGRRNEALAALEHDTSDLMDLRLLHAELLVERDCARARASFARLKPRVRSRAEDERVDFGYARALQACGREVELERALRLYQDRHPHGTHTGTVKGWLQKRARTP